MRFCTAARRTGRVGIQNREDSLDILEYHATLPPGAGDIRTQETEVGWSVSSVVSVMQRERGEKGRMQI